ncbi:TAXI family TRAP transporter solute-binding subunit [Acidaminococcus intestini]|uniref:TAXI family TRAP transporter solute-binding subunit n=1 Tax=Acidaminococcus intestini TaxID=187327 RepID=UPI00040634CB|nr:TAXI family TRAP transporter solute-binding subunit [Acidaminococcus intestini]
MKVKKVVTSILAMLVAGSVIAGCGGSGGDKKSADGKLDRSKQFVTVLTGPTSGIYFPIGGAFSKVVGEMGYKTSSTATGATVENINGILTGKGELAIAMSDSVIQVLCQMLGCPTTKSPFRNSARHLPSSFFANSHRESGS